MTMTSIPPARLSLYGQIAADFRERILSGELKPGEKLPSFTAMRQRHRVSQATLNRVHSILESEGLILRRRGSGIFVSNSQDALASDATNGSGAPASFLSNAVVILTPFGKPSKTHRSGGWLEWIAYGASDAVQQAAMHAVSLNPQITDAEIERLIEEKPFGALVPANLSESSTPLNLLKKLRSRGIPVVAFGSSSALAECDHVASDHECGAYELTRFLLSRGKRRIVNVQPTNFSETWLDERHRGYEKAMKEAGLKPEPALLIPSPTLLASAQLIVGNEDVSEASKKALLSEDIEIFESIVRTTAGYFVESLCGASPVDGLLATTDRNTFVLAAICRLFGKDPNREVLIAGYDNYYVECEERFVAPFAPVATIDKRNRALGAAMVQLLLDRVSGKLDDAPQMRIIEPKLVVTVP